MSAPVFLLLLNSGGGTVAGGFTADSVLKRTESATFVADSWIILVTAPVTFTANAVIKRTEPATFTANAIIKRTRDSATTPYEPIVILGTGQAYFRRTAANTFFIGINADMIPAGLSNEDTIVVVSGVRNSAGGNDPGASLTGTSSLSWSFGPFVRGSGVGSIRVMYARYAAGEDLTVPNFGDSGVNETGMLTVLYLRNVDPVMIDATPTGALNSINPPATTMGGVLQLIFGVGGTDNDGDDYSIGTADWTEVTVNESSTSTVATAMGSGVWKRTVSTAEDYASFATMSHTSGGNLLQTSIPLRPVVYPVTTFTADAIIKGPVAGTFTADSVFYGTVAGSFTADAVIAAAGASTISVTFTADAVILRTESVTFVADAVLKATLAQSFTADAILLTITSVTFTADAVLKATISQTLTADAVLKSTLAATFTADAVVVRTESATFTADAYLLSVVSATFTANSVLKATIAGSFTGNSVLKSTLAGSFTGDAVLKSTLSVTFTANAIIKKTVTPAFIALDTFSRTLSNSWGSADIGGTWTTTLQTGSSDVDVDGDSGLLLVGVAGQNTQGMLNSVAQRDVDIIVTASFNKIPTGGSAFLHVGARATGTAIAGSTRYVGQVEITTAGLLNANFFKSVSGTQTSITSAVSTGVTVSANELFKVRFQAEGASPTTLRIRVWKATDSEPGTWLVTNSSDSEATLQSTGGLSLRLTTAGALSNAPITVGTTAYETRATDPLGPALADAILKAPVNGTLTANAVIKSTLASTFTADAIIKGTLASTFTADAVLKSTLATTFTADALIIRVVESTFVADAVIKAPVGGSFTADALLYGAVEGSFTASAILRATESAVFTADAYLLVIVAEEFTADAIIAGSVAAAFTADAVLLTTAESTFTADSRLLTVTSGSFTANAILLVAGEFDFTADAVILFTFPVTFTADARISPRPTRVRPATIAPSGQRLLRGGTAEQILGAGSQGPVIKPQGHQVIRPRNQ